MLSKLKLQSLGWYASGQFYTASCANANVCGCSTDRDGYIKTPPIPDDTLQGHRLPSAVASGAWDDRNRLNTRATNVDVWTIHASQHKLQVMMGSCHFGMVMI